MAEVIRAGFKGMVRQSLYPWLEKAGPQYALEAYDVVFDQYGNVYSNYGFKNLSSSPVSTPANVSTLYYSTTFDRILMLEGTSLKVINPATGATTATHAGFTSGAKLSFAEWPQTSTVYVSDPGVSYKRLSTSGTTLSGALSSTGAGSVIISHKSRVWSAENNSVFLYPSDADTPETFTTSNGLRFDEDGTPITALCIQDGMLFVHKPTNIFLVVGDSIDDFAKRNLNTGRGAVGKWAAISFERIIYYITNTGLYSYNLEKQAQVSRMISCDLGLRMNIPVNDAQVVPLQPFWPPDFGKRYILFNLRPAPGMEFETWKYDVDTQDMVRLFYQNSFNALRMCYSTLNERTFLVASSQAQLSMIDFVESYGGETITGVYTTGQDNCEIPHAPKEYGMLNMFPTTDVPQRNADIDGLGSYGFDLTALNDDYSATESVYNADNNQVGYMMSVRNTISGGLKQILTGYSLEYEPVAVGPGRGYASSRLELSKTLLTFNQLSNDGYLTANNAAVILYSEVAGLSGSQWTLTHNKGFAPTAIINSFSRQLAQFPAAVKANPSSIISYTKDAITCRSGFSDNDSDQGSLPATGARVRQEMMIVKSPISQIGLSFIAAGQVKVLNGASSTITVRHGLGVTPTAIFLQRDLLGTTSLASATPGFDIQNSNALTFDIALSGAASSEFNVHWVAVAMHTNETLFRCGSASVSTTGTDLYASVTHGLSLTPRHIIVGEDFAGTWRNMYVAALTTTTFTIRYTSASAFTFNWIVFASPGGGGVFSLEPIIIIA